jgi:hypothetical protein
VQYNNSGAFGGNADWTTDGAGNTTQIATATMGAAVVTSPVSTGGQAPVFVTAPSYSGGGGTIGIGYGANAAVNNMAFWNFSYTGSGSGANYTCLNFYGGSCVFTISPAGWIKGTTTTVSSLPSASLAGAGAMIVVTDATATTGGTCTGSGSDTSLAISNGTNWTCH